MVMQEFRPDEGVDIAQDGSGYTVGWNRAGEYMRYTVDVDEAGKPLPEFRAIAGRGGYWP